MDEREPNEVLAFVSHTRDDPTGKAMGCDTLNIKVSDKRKVEGTGHHREALSGNPLSRQWAGVGLVVLGRNRGMGSLGC